MRKSLRSARTRSSTSSRATPQTEQPESLATGLLDVYTRWWNAQLPPAERVGTAEELAEAVALGVLPFFHSYGYTTTLWTPLTLEPAVVYHTDLRDGQTVGRLAREHHATILMATPTFLRIYIRRTPAEDFSTLEAVFGAAEKLTKDVSDAFEKKFGVRPSEAYGATELAPLVAANVPPSRHVPGRPVDTREGTVGQPILGCKARITLSFSSRTSSAPNRLGGSIAIRHNSCIKWFCTMSRIAPDLS